MNAKTEPVPSGLRIWFVIHFIVDILFALPLLFIPELIMPLFGWQSVDPLTSRLVGAALLGIGGESLFSRNASGKTFLSLLRLKIIWASAAIFGMGLALNYGAPITAWGFIAIFVIFLIAWLYYYFRLKEKALE